MSRYLPRVLAIGLLSLLALPDTCFACSCPPPRPPTEATAGATTVFRGRVTATTLEGAPQGYRYRRATFQVDTVWKGALGREVVIFTGGGGGDCGYDFVPGQEYVVYARQSPGGSLLPAGLVTGICERTRPVSSAAEDLAALGSGSAPDEVGLPRLPNTGAGSVDDDATLSTAGPGSARGGFVPLVVSAALTFMVLLVAGLTLWQRRSQRRDDDDRR